MPTSSREDNVQPERSSTAATAPIAHMLPVDLLTTMVINSQPSRRAGPPCLGVRHPIYVGHPIVMVALMFWRLYL